MSVQAALVERWLGAALAVYGDAMAAAAVREADPFRNPVGSRLRTQLEQLAGELLGGMDPQVIDRCFADIMAVRAVQDLAPQRALEFVFAPRHIVPRVASRQVPADLEARIDRLALAAFAQYLQQRTRMAELRYEEQRRALGPLPYRLRRQPPAAADS
ncbi:MAG: RsbRD N-terminal domain-containing protein [Gammaproteobacteria bacterium]|nr:RsbRD N-terminal domain-containing protein [Gammaproteobacteria bacterium]